MANVSVGAVKELRERTGAGMMDCKKALIECNGDMDKDGKITAVDAMLILRAVTLSGIGA